MKIHFSCIAVAALALCGCKDMKASQHAPYIGDNQTKIFYKNVGEFKDKVPEGRRITFKSADEAMQAGYTSSQEGASDDSAPAEQ